MTNIYQVLVFAIVLGIKSCHACGKAILQSKILTVLLPKGQKTLCNQGIWYTLLKFVRRCFYTIGKLREAWRTPISYDSSLGSRGRCRPLPTFSSIYFNTFPWLLLKRKTEMIIMSCCTGFAFTSRKYLFQHLPMTASAIM